MPAASLEAVLNGSSTTEGPAVRGPRGRWRVPVRLLLAGGGAGEDVGDAGAAGIVLHVGQLDADREAALRAAVDGAERALDALLADLDLGGAADRRLDVGDVGEGARDRL